MGRRLCVWAFGAAVGFGPLVTPSVATARHLPLQAGAALGYRSPAELRLMGELQWMPTGLFGLRLRGGPYVRPHTFGAVVLAGPQMSLDVMTVVPSFYVLGGVDVREPGRALLHVGAELGYYVALHTALTASVACEWSGQKRLFGVATLGASYQF